MRDANGGTGNGDAGNGAGSAGAGNATGPTGKAGTACATGTPIDLWTSGVLSTTALNPFNGSAV